MAVVVLARRRRSGAPPIATLACLVRRVGRRARRGGWGDRARSASPAGATVQVGIHPSKCVITKLKRDKDRKQRRAKAELENKKDKKGKKNKKDKKDKKDKKEKQRRTNKQKPKRRKNQR